MTRQEVQFLLAEDNEDDILLIEESFAEANIKNPITFVRDGEEALQYLRKQGQYANVTTPSLVILDINMPKKGGLDVLREMKSDPALRHLPVVILTTSQREVDIARAYAEGASSYIAKPQRFEDFRDVMQRFTSYWLGVVQFSPSHKVR